MKRWIISHERMFDIITWVAIAIQLATIILRLWVFKRGTDGYNVMFGIWGASVVVWLIAFTLSILSPILKNKKPKSKYNKPQIESFSWDDFDHSHFCIAAQLLNDKDFEAVCPHHGKVEDIARCDACDYCKYMAIVDFNTDKDGSKNISLYIKTSLRPSVQMATKE